MSLISQSEVNTSHDAYFYYLNVGLSYCCDYSGHTATTPGTGLLLARCVAVPKVVDYSWPVTPAQTSCYVTLEGGNSVLCQLVAACYIDNASHEKYGRMVKLNVS